MNRKRILRIIVSLAMVLGMALPGTLMATVEEDTAGEELSVTSEVEAPEVEETPDATETPEATETSEAEGEESSVPEEAATEGSEETPEGGAPTVAQNPESGNEGSSGEQSLFERLMACETLEELYTLIDETPEEELLQLSESEVAEVEAKINALEPEPLPPLVLEESTDEPVISEIVYPSVNFSNVAPFGDPVIGGVN